MRNAICLKLWEYRAENQLEEDKEMPDGKCEDATDGSTERNLFENLYHPWLEQKNEKSRRRCGAEVVELDAKIVYLNA